MDRELPYNVELEQALIGAYLVDNYHLDKISNKLNSTHFYDSCHALLYSMTMKMWGEGKNVTPLTLAHEIGPDENFDSLGGEKYLISLARAAPALPNVSDYIRILIDLATRRELILIAGNIVDMAHLDTDIDHTKIIEEAEKSLYSISERTRFNQDDVSFSSAIAKALARTEKALNGTDNTVQTGLKDLDNLLGGLHHSDLVIVAGRPGMGKTALATNFAFHASSKNNIPVMLFSLEMSNEQLANRIISEQSQIDSYKIRSGKLSDYEFDNYVRTSQTLNSTKLFIDDTAGISIAQIAARARKAKREHNIGLIVVDYIQLISGSRRFENRVQELSEITKGLKNIAKELDIPVVALSQLSRSVESREDKRPILSDLRESGSIEQDADVVMFVYREAYYLKSREPQPGTNEHIKWMDRLDQIHNVAEIMVEKHRHGPTNKVEVNFDDRFTKFSDLVGKK